MHQYMGVIFYYTGFSILNLDLNCLITCTFFLRDVYPTCTCTCTCTLCSATLLRTTINVDKISKGAVLMEYCCAMC